MTERRQKPLGTGYHRFTEAGDIMSGIDLGGQTAIVTGGNSGVGLGVAQALARAGARVVIPARDVDKARRRRSAIRGECVIFPVDLTDLDSIRAFVKDYSGLTDRLPLLFNCAGVHTPENPHTNGVETTLLSNVLGPLVLTRLLRDALARADNAKVVFVSSCAHLDAEIDWGDVNFRKRPWAAHPAYAQSNVFRNLATVLLQDLWGELDIRFNSVHPGFVDTDIMRNFTYQQKIDIGLYDENGAIRPERLAARKTVSQGAAPVLFAAFDARAGGGAYIDEGCDLAPEATPETPQYTGVSAFSLDAGNARRMAPLLQSMAPEGIDLFF